MVQQLKLGKLGSPTRKFVQKQASTQNDNFNIDKRVRIPQRRFKSGVTKKTQQDSLDLRAKKERARQDSGFKSISQKTQEARSLLAELKKRKIQQEGIRDRLRREAQPGTSGRKEKLIAGNVANAKSKAIARLISRFNQIVPQLEQVRSAVGTLLILGKDAEAKNLINKANEIIIPRDVAEQFIYRTGKGKETREIQLPKFRKKRQTQIKKRTETLQELRAVGGKVTVSNLGGFSTKLTQDQAEQLSSETRKDLGIEEIKTKGREIIDYAGSLQAQLNAESDTEPAKRTLNVSDRVNILFNKSSLSWKEKLNLAFLTGGIEDKGSLTLTEEEFKKYSEEDKIIEPKGFIAKLESKGAFTKFPEAKFTNLIAMTLASNPLNIGKISTSTYEDILTKTQAVRLIEPAYKSGVFIEGLALVGSDELGKAIQTDIVTKTVGRAVSYTIDDRLKPSARIELGENITKKVTGVTAGLLPSTPLELGIDIALLGSGKLISIGRGKLFSERITIGKMGGGIIKPTAYTKIFKLTTENKSIGSIAKFVQISGREAEISLTATRFQIAKSRIFGLDVSKLSLTTAQEFDVARDIIKGSKLEITSPAKLLISRTDNLVIIDGRIVGSISAGRLRGVGGLETFGAVGKRATPRILSRLEGEIYEETFEIGKINLKKLTPIQRRAIKDIQTDLGGTFAKGMKVEFGGIKTTDIIKSDKLIKPGRRTRRGDITAISQEQISVDFGREIGIKKLEKISEKIAVADVSLPAGITKGRKSNIITGEIEAYEVGVKIPDKESLITKKRTLKRIAKDQKFKDNIISETKIISGINAKKVTKVIKPTNLLTKQDIKITRALSSSAELTQAKIREVSRVSKLPTTVGGGGGGVSAFAGQSIYERVGGQSVVIPSSAMKGKISPIVSAPSFETYAFKSEAITRTFTKPVTKTLTKPVTKIITKPVTKTLTKPVTKTLTKSLTKTITKTTTKTTPKSPFATPRITLKPGKTTGFLPIIPFLLSDKKAKIIPKPRKRKPRESLFLVPGFTGRIASPKITIQKSAIPKTAMQFQTIKTRPSFRIK